MIDSSVIGLYVNVLWVRRRWGHKVTGVMRSCWCQSGGASLVRTDVASGSNCTVRRDDGGVDNSATVGLGDETDDERDNSADEEESSDHSSCDDAACYAVRQPTVVHFT